MARTEQVAESQRRLAARLDDMLPQTQCGKCGHPGCRPYAEAMASRGERPDRCAPGGNQTSRKLAAEIAWDSSDLRELPTPVPEVAVVDEQRCVGCFKCIEACPVDAVVGAHGHMHSVVSDWCTGCGHCVPVCPVYCISIVGAEGNDGDGQRVIGGVHDSNEALAAAGRLRERHQRKLSRPPLRSNVGDSTVEPAELARRAMVRARRSAKGEST